MSEMNDTHAHKFLGRAPSHAVNKRAVNVFCYYYTSEDTVFSFTSRALECREGGLYKVET